MAKWFEGVSEIPELIEGYVGSAECPKYGGCDSDDLVEVSLEDSTPFWEIVDEDFDFGELVEDDGKSYKMRESTTVRYGKHLKAAAAALGEVTGLVSPLEAAQCAADAEDSEGGVFPVYYDMDPVD